MKRLSFVDTCLTYGHSLQKQSYNTSPNIFNTLFCQVLDSTRHNNLPPVPLKS